MAAADPEALERLLRELEAWPVAWTPGTLERAGVGDAEALREALRTNGLRTLLGEDAGGARAGRALARAAARIPSRSPERDLVRARETATTVLEILQGHGEAVRLGVAGALRAMAPRVGRIEIVATAHEPTALLDAFAAEQRVTAVVNRTDEAVEVALDDGALVHLTALPENGTAFVVRLLESVGPESHVEALVARARELGFAWPGREIAAVAALPPLEIEADLYAALDVPFVPPERRLALLPGAPEEDLLDARALAGVAGFHTDQAAGRFPLATMLEAALREGYRWALSIDCGPGLGAKSIDAAGIDRLRDERDALPGGDGEEPRHARGVVGARLAIDEGGLVAGAAELRAAEYVVGVAAGRTAGAHAGESLAFGTRLLAALASGELDALEHPRQTAAGTWGNAMDDWLPVLRSLSYRQIAFALLPNADSVLFPAGWGEAVRDLGVRVLLCADAYAPPQFDRLLATLGWARREGIPKAHILNALPTPPSRTSTRRASHPLRP